jgi:hypothetical protein
VATYPRLAEQSEIPIMVHYYTDWLEDGLPGALHRHERSDHPTGICTFNVYRTTVAVGLFFLMTTM